jgi:hypothetical protein
MTDFVTRGQERLANQFADKPKILGVVKAMLSAFGGIEETADQIRAQRNLYIAQGKQLDGLGYIVGEARQGREDDEYRDAIIFRIFVNTSNGTPEDLLKGLRYLTKPDDVQYMEQYPATAMLFTDGATIPKYLQSTMQSLSPAAISDVQILVSYAWKSPFRFGSQPQPSELFVNGDVDYLEASGSDLQVQTVQAESGSRFSGIAAADLMVDGDCYLDVGLGTLAINSPNNNNIIDSGAHLTGVF